MNRLPVVLAGGAIAAQIAYPLTSGQARDLVTVAVVTLLAAAGLAHAATRRGPVWTAGFFAITAGVGFASEVVGTATGYPYGCYAYAVDRLGPALFDVPLVVPLAWTAGMYPVWYVASLLAGRGGISRPDGNRERVTRIALTTVGMVGWDLYLDPQMVSDGQWDWCNGGGLPGLEQIPLTNYLGWIVVATLMAVGLDLLDRTGPVQPGTDTVPLVLFLWTWLGSALAHSVFLGVPELKYSALYGAAVMSTLGVPLLWSLRRRAGVGARV